MAEQAQLQHSLGTAHAEQRPVRREDTQRRISQLRALVASTSVEAQIAGGRAMGTQYYRGRNVAPVVSVPIRDVHSILASNLPGYGALLLASKKKE